MLRAVQQRLPKTKPVFSPLGERIAFESEEDIWVVDLGTGATRRLNTSIFRANDRAAAWSPDGERIAFVSNRDGQVDLWVMSVEGERHGLVRLTNDPAREEDPQWSPDGKTIVFSAKRRDEHYMATGVYVVSSTGGPARRLTPVDSTDNFGARWSPDGKRLALLSDRSGYVHVWIINADGTEWRELDTGPHDSMSPYWTVRPVWSRDGKRILISVNRDGRFDLVATDVDAAGGERIGTEPGQYHEVGWAYDGSIVYAYDSAWSPPNLYLTKPGVRRLGGLRIRPTAPSGWNTLPMFSVSPSAPSMGLRSVSWHRCIPATMRRPQSGDVPPDVEFWVAAAPWPA